MFRCHTCGKHRLARREDRCRCQSSTFPFVGKVVNVFGEQAPSKVHQVEPAAAEEREHVPTALELPAGENVSQEDGVGGSRKSACLSEQPRNDSMSEEEENTVNQPSVDSKGVQTESWSDEEEDNPPPQPSVDSKGVQTESWSEEEEDNLGTQPSLDSKSVQETEYDGEEQEEDNLSPQPSVDHKSVCDTEDDDGEEQEEEEEEDNLSPQPSLDSKSVQETEYDLEDEGVSATETTLQVSCASEMTVQDFSPFRIEDSLWRLTYGHACASFMKEPAPMEDRYSGKTAKPGNHVETSQPAQAQSPPPLTATAFPALPPANNSNMPRPVVQHGWITSGTGKRYRKTYRMRDFPMGYTRRKVFGGYSCNVEEGGVVCGRLHPSAHHNECMDVWETFVPLSTPSVRCVECENFGHTKEQCGQGDFFDQPWTKIPSGLAEHANPWPQDSPYMPLPMYYTSPREYARGYDYPSLPEAHKEGLKGGLAKKAAGKSIRALHLAVSEAVNYVDKLPPKKLKAAKQENPALLRARQAGVGVKKTRVIENKPLIGVQDGVKPAPVGVPAHGHKKDAPVWFFGAFTKFLDPFLAENDKEAVEELKDRFDMESEMMLANPEGLVYAQQAAAFVQQAFEIYADYMQWCNGGIFNPSKSWRRDKIRGGAIFPKAEIAQPDARLRRTTLVEEYDATYPLHDSGQTEYEGMKIEGTKMQWSDEDEYIDPFHPDGQPRKGSKHEPEDVEGHLSYWTEMIDYELSDDRVAALETWSELKDDEAVQAYKGLMALAKQNGVQQTKADQRATASETETADQGKTPVIVTKELAVSGEEDSTEELRKHLKGFAECRSRLITGLKNKAALFKSKRVNLQVAVLEQEAREILNLFRQLDDTVETRGNSLFRSAQPGSFGALFTQIAEIGLDVRRVEGAVMGAHLPGRSPSSSLLPRFAMPLGAFKAAMVDEEEEEEEDEGDKEDA